MPAAPANSSATNAADNSADLAIINGRLVLAADTVQSAALIIKAGRIAEIGELPAGWHGPVLDAQQLFVSPGFIDLQLNGGFGHDFTTDPESIWAVAEQLPQYGVTAFLPTIITSPPDTIANAQRALGLGGSGSPAAPSAPAAPISGRVGRAGSAAPAAPTSARATPLGLHLEGPMLNLVRAGAHRLEHLRPPSGELICEWTPATGIAIVTIAPELPGALAVIAELASRGIIVALGHSDTTSEDAAQAVAAGASFVTHLYHAMSPFHHRQPGLVGFTLGRRDIAASIIADGFHSEPIAVATAWNAKRSPGIVLVTDAGAPLGMPDGSYVLGSTTVTVAGSEVRTPTGTIAGTNLTMPQAIRNLIEFTGCHIAEAVMSATATPARVLGNAAKGTLSIGADADVVIFDDQLEIAHTIIGGEMAHGSASASSRQ